MQKLLIFILFLTSNILHGSNFMMNCVSSDFKEMAFYKFLKKTNSSESKLLSRPMKTKWQDFCASSFDYKVSCAFKDMQIKRISIKNSNNGDKNKSIYELDFVKHQLRKTIITDISHKNSSIKEIKFKCRKIKI